MFSLRSFEPLALVIEREADTSLPLFYGGEQVHIN